MKKLAIITTHPIQYNAPFFKRLTKRGKVQLKVFYTWPQAIDGFDDPDFKTKVEWDIPLLNGYQWEAVDNVAKNPGSKHWSGIDCPDLISRITLFAPDAVMVYGWNLKSHFQVMRVFKGKKPVWFFGDSTLLDEKPGLRKKLRRVWLSWIYRHIDKAFYVGENNFRYFSAHGLKKDQLIFFPHAIDNDRFTDNPERMYEEKAFAWREKLGYKDTDIVVLFAGKFEAKKNPVQLLEVIQLVHKTINQHIRLLFVGNGPLESELRIKSKDLNFVQFLPFQNQSIMPVIYRIGNLYCLPSKGPGETWGLGVNEAMACHRPALVSDRVGCALDLVKQFVTGAIFHADEMEDLSCTLQSTLKSDLKKLGISANKLIMNWSIDKKCDAIEQSLSKL